MLGRVLLLASLLTSALVQAGGSQQRLQCRTTNGGTASNERAVLIDVPQIPGAETSPSKCLQRAAGGVMVRIGVVRADDRGDGALLPLAGGAERYVIARSRGAAETEAKVDLQLLGVTETLYRMRGDVFGQQDVEILTARVRIKDHVVSYLATYPRNEAARHRKSIARVFSGARVRVDGLGDVRGLPRLPEPKDELAECRTDNMADGPHFREVLIRTPRLPRAYFKNGCRQIIGDRSPEVVVSVEVLRSAPVDLEDAASPEKALRSQARDVKRLGSYEVELLGQRTKVHRSQARFLRYSEVLEKGEALNAVVKLGDHWVWFTAAYPQAQSDKYRELLLAHLQDIDVEIASERRP